MGQQVFAGEADLYVTTLAVAPAFRAEGCAAALLRWVARRAAAEGARVYAEAAGSQRAVFEEAGFGEVWAREVDAEDEDAAGPLHVAGMGRALNEAILGNSVDSSSPLLSGYRERIRL